MCSSDLSPFFFAPLRPLIQLGMAGVAESGYAVVMGFDAHALPVPLLVGMSGHHSPIVYTAELAWRASDNLKQGLVSVHAPSP